MLSTTPGEIQTAMASKFPTADFEPYFRFLETTTGNDHKHHVAPKKVFPDLKRNPENIRPLSFQEHFYAHYLLAWAVPDCASIQQAFFSMTHMFAGKIRTDELPYFAETYASAQEIVREDSRERCTVLMADPELKAAATKRIIAFNADPEFRAKRDAAATKVMGVLRVDPQWRAALGKKISAALQADPKIKAAMSQRTIAMNADPRVKRAASERLTTLWADPEFRKTNKVARDKARIAMWADPEWKIAQSKRTSAMNADPEFKEAARKRRRTQNADPEFKAKHLAAMTTLHADPKFKAALSKRMIALQTDPEFRAKGNAALQVWRNRSRFYGS